MNAITEPNPTELHATIKLGIDAHAKEAETGSGKNGTELSRLAVSSPEQRFGELGPVLRDPSFFLHAAHFLRPMRERRMPCHSPRQLAAGQPARSRSAFPVPLIAARRWREAIVYDAGDRELFLETFNEACVRTG